MENHFALIMFIWTLGTSLLCVGVSWGTVRSLQKQFAGTLNDVVNEVKSIGVRVSHGEQHSTTHDDCQREQAECEKSRNYHENHLVKKIDELYALTLSIDTKRENTRKELNERLLVISNDLAVLKHTAGIE